MVIEQLDEDFWITKENMNELCKEAGIPNEEQAVLEYFARHGWYVLYENGEVTSIEGIYERNQSRKFLEEIAGYVNDESYIDFVDEEKRIIRYLFDCGDMFVYYGIVQWAPFW